MLHGIAGERFTKAAHHHERLRSGISVGQSGSADGAATALGSPPSIGRGMLHRP